MAEELSMTEKKENTPFVIDFRQKTPNNYGTASSSIVATTSAKAKTNNNNNDSIEMPTTPSHVYCLHGHKPVEVRDHCHRQRSEGVDVRARKKLIIASVLCLFFMVCEVVGGVLSNSLAIATDAAHLLTDFASFMISLFAIWIAGRPSTQRMSFGWYRAEVIGAMASVVMIWVITGILVYLAVERVIYRNFELDAGIMLITSALAIIVNIIMGFQLHHGHGHGGHGHSHGPSAKKAPLEPQILNEETIRVSDLDNGQKSQPVTLGTPVVSSSTHTAVTKEPENMNVRAALIHVIGDMVQSVGVFIAALVIFFKPEWAIVDPVCTFLFSIIVLSTTFFIMKDALLVLMEGTPDYMHYAEVLDVFKNIEGVERVHNLRIWALSINKIALSVHLAIAPNADPKEILKQANSAVHIRYSFFETTIQIEDFTPAMENCVQCSVPSK